MAAQAARFAITTVHWTMRRIQRGILIAVIGRQIGATWALTKATLKNMGGGGIIGLVVGILTTVITMGMAMKHIAKTNDEDLKMKKDAFHNEQRRQQMEVTRTNSFLAMAKAISSDAGVAMAFRPDLLDPLRRDEVARSVIDYLDDIARGVATPAHGDVGLIIGATP
jgi:hypothetical protein